MRASITQLTTDELRREIIRLEANGKADSVRAHLLRGELARRTADKKRPEGAR